MKIIKIIRGTYGYRKEGTRLVEPIDKNSDPITVSDQEAERLVSLGVAKVLDDASTETFIGHVDAGQFESYSYKQLQELAKNMGLKASGSKEELIERITAAEVEAPTNDETDENTDDDAETDDESGEEEPPVLSAVDPE